MCAFFLHCRWSSQRRPHCADNTEQRLEGREGTDIKIFGKSIFQAEVWANAKTWPEGRISLGVQGMVRRPGGWNWLRKGRVIGVDISKKSGSGEERRFYQTLKAIVRLLAFTLWNKKPWRVWNRVVTWHIFKDCSGCMLQIDWKWQGWKQGTRQA